jgi:hypothetical protein
MKLPYTIRADNAITSGNTTIVAVRAEYDGIAFIASAKAVCSPEDFNKLDEDERAEIGYKLYKLAYSRAEKKVVAQVNKYIDSQIDRLNKRIDTLKHYRDQSEGMAKEADHDTEYFATLLNDDEKEGE